MSLCKFRMPFILNTALFPQQSWESAEKEVGMSKGME